jgi:hypothetical protein
MRGDSNQAALGASGRVFGRPQMPPTQTGVKQMTPTFKHWLLVAALSPALAHAQNAWHWDFSSDAIDLQDQRSVTISVTNEASSNDDIRSANLDLSSMPNVGLLFESTGQGVITPVISGVAPSFIHPGETLTVLRVNFVLVQDNLPTPGVAYEWSPTLSVQFGSNCTPATSSLPGCGYVQSTARNPLLVSYAAVPEPTTLLQLSMGLLAIGALARRRPSKT